MTELFLRAAVESVLVSAIASVVGVFLVLNEETSMAGSLAHFAFFGVGLALFLKLPPPVLSYPLTAVASAFLSLPSRIPRELRLTTTWATGMALGILFVSLSSGYSSEITSYLFGSVLLVSNSDLLISAINLLAVLVFLLLFYKPLVALSFDEEYARTVGIPVDGLRLAFNVLAGLSIVTAINLVGLVLVVAFFSLPVATGLGIAKRLPQALLLSFLVGSVSAAGGVAASFLFNVPPSAVAVLIMGAIYWTSLAVQKRLGTPSPKSL